MRIGGRGGCRDGWSPSLARHGGAQGHSPGRRVVGPTKGGVVLPGQGEAKGPHGSGGPSASLQDTGRRGIRRIRSPLDNGRPRRSPAPLRQAAIAPRTAAGSEAREGGQLSEDVLSVHQGGDRL